MIALSTRTPNASMSRQSAEIWSPCSSTTMSPGTSCSIGSWTTLPSRTMAACCGSSWRSAASVCSARCSCQNENTALTRITTTMAYPTFAIPSPGALHSAKNASAAATHRISAKKWVSPWRKRSSGCSRRSSSTRLGPNSRSRRRASAVDRPCGVLFRLARASASESWSIRKELEPLSSDVGASSILSCRASSLQVVCTNARRRSVSVMIPTRRPPSTTGSAPNP